MKLVLFRAVDLPCVQVCLFAAVVYRVSIPEASVHATPGDCVHRLLLDCATKRCSSDLLDAAVV